MEQAALHDAVADLRGEQAIIWPFAGAKEIVSAGLASVLNIDTAPGGWYDSFRALLCEPDRDSLEQAVDGQRQNRHDYNMAVKTREGARTISVRGDSVVAGAVGAAVLLISDGSADSGQIARFATHSAELHQILDALPIPIWLRDSDFTLKYANHAYSAAVEADGDTPYDQLPEIAAVVGAQADGAALAARAPVPLEFCRAKSAMW